MSFKEEVPVTSETPADVSWKWVTEHVIFSTFRRIFQPPQQDAKNGTVLQVANLTDLYKVFERC